MKKPAPLAKSDVEVTRIRARTMAKLIDGGVKVGRALIWATAVVGVAYVVMRGLQAFAGHETRLDSAVRWAMDLNVSRWAGWAVASIIGVGWRIERTTRQRTIVDVQDYVKKLEATIDPERTTSRLLPTGKPRKEDLDD